MSKLREKFTKWYMKKGYTFGYYDLSTSSAVWNCPWYVKPFLFLFSPSVYCMKIGSYYISKGFIEGLAKGFELKEAAEEDGE